MSNSWTLDTLIRELIAVKNKLSPETEVRISMPLHKYGGHTYDISEFRFSQLPLEPEHTCEAECTCQPEHVDFNQTNSACPVCYCPGCADEPTDRIMYIVMGDQDPHSMPSETDPVEEL